MSESLLLKPYQPELKADWDAVVGSSINGTFIHTRDFIAYHGNRFKECSLIFYWLGKPVAVFPAEYSDGHVFSHRGLTHAGWIVCKDLEEGQLEQILNTTFQYFERLGFQSLEVRSVPDFFCLGSNSALKTSIQKFKPEIVSKPIFHATPLPFEISDRGRKWGRKKAVCQGLRVAETDDFEGFWNNVLEPHLWEKFQNKPVHQLKEIRYLKSCFQEEIKLFAVYRETEMLAGTVLFLQNKVVHCQYIASTAKGRESRALDLLFDELLDKFNVDKSYLSLGTSLDARTGKPIPSLVKWKESLGGQGVEGLVLRWEGGEGRF
ncbi:hypothetical protein [Aquiflexum lacus]|uniref:hypothetical protein n=1 Tax=Aquiflexum lacus TaxID=2483805 RepID=UPI001893C128|nr:hypothetical protein [Aquiflexum lacus]